MRWADPSTGPTPIGGSDRGLLHDDTVHGARRAGSVLQSCISGAAQFSKFLTSRQPILLFCTSPRPTPSVSPPAVAFDVVMLDNVSKVDRLPLNAKNDPVAARDASLQVVLLGLNRLDPQAWRGLPFDQCDRCAVARSLPFGWK